MGKKIAQNALYLTTASVGQKILAFVYFIFLARIMQPENTGAYFLTISITTIFTVIANFGITKVIIRETAKHPKQAETLIRGALGVKLPLMLLAVVFANVAAWLLNYGPEVQFLVLLGSVTLVLGPVATFFYGILRGRQLLKYEAVGMFLTTLIMVGFGGAVLLLNPTLPLLVAALLIGEAFNVIFAGVNVARVMGVRVLIPAFDLNQIKTLLAIAFPFALADIFVKVYSYTDSLLLGKFMNEAAVGIYSVAYKFTYAFQFLPLAFIAALYPGLSEMLVKRDVKLQKTFDDALWYMALIAVPITFGIFAIAPDVVNLTGEGYVRAVPVLQALIFVLIPIFLDFPIGALLNAADRQVTKTTIMGITMVTNVVLNIVFIPMFGIIGAAYAALISFTLMFVMGLYFIPQIILDYQFGALIKKLFPILISGIVMGFVAWYLRPVVGYVLTIPVAAVVYGAMLFLTRTVGKEHVIQFQDLFRLNGEQYVKDITHDD